MSQLELSKLINQKNSNSGIKSNSDDLIKYFNGHHSTLSYHSSKKFNFKQPHLLAEERLYQMAIKSRPLLQKHKQLISAAKSRLDLAERDYYPDFNVGVTYGDSTGQNPQPMGVLKTCRPYL